MGTVGILDKEMYHCVSLCRHSGIFDPQSLLVLLTIKTPLLPMSKCPVGMWYTTNTAHWLMGAQPQGGSRLPFDTETSSDLSGTLLLNIQDTFLSVNWNVCLLCPTHHHHNDHH